MIVVCDCGSEIRGLIGGYCGPPCRDTARAEWREHRAHRRELHRARNERRRATTGPPPLYLI